MDLYIHLFGNFISINNVMSPLPPALQKGSQDTHYHHPRAGCRWDMGRGVLASLLESAHAYIKPMGKSILQKTIIQL